MPPFPAYSFLMAARGLSFMALKAGNQSCQHTDDNGKAHGRRRKPYGDAGNIPAASAHAHEPGTEKFIDQAGNAVA